MQEHMIAVKRLAEDPSCNSLLQEGQQLVQGMLYTHRRARQVACEASDAALVLDRRPTQPADSARSDARDPAGHFWSANRAGDEDGLAQSVADAARAATTQQTPETAINTLTALVLRNGPWDAASVTILDHGGSLTTIAATCQLALQADRLQLKWGEGPFPDAMEGEPVVLAEDLQVEQRWPQWVPDATGLGFVSAAALRLFTDATLGSLNLYSRQIIRNELSAVQTAGIVAAHVSVFVAHARAERSLGQAIQSRNLIGQAQGMMMHRYGISAESAFHVLRRYSQNLNTKLVVIAEQFVGTGELPDLENPPRTTANHPTS